MNTVTLHNEQLREFHKCMDMLAYSIEHVKLEGATLAIDQEATDANGPHWQGYRVRVNAKGEEYAYLHIGMIYFPETYKGLMVEVDWNNNKEQYDAIIQRVGKSPFYTIKHEEKEYFKLFLPADDFQSLVMSDSAQFQTAMIQSFLYEAITAIVGDAEPAQLQPFSAKIEDFSNLLGLNNLALRVLQQMDCPDYTTQVDLGCTHNFGSYANGYRAYLTATKTGKQLYAYAGLIYSYKKEPYGAFVEIDEFSNQEHFSEVQRVFVANDGFLASMKEKGFIKLFMTKEQNEQFNNSKTIEEQEKVLQDFYHACMHAFIQPLS